LATVNTGPATLAGAADPSNNPLAPTSVAGPGDQFTSAQQAAAYGSIYAYWSAPDNGEYAGEVYQNANGTYSFDVGRPSEPNPPDFSVINPGAIPDGTSFSGFYHTHGDDPSALGYFTPDDNTTNGRYANSPLFPNYQGMSVSLPNGDILWRSNTGLQSTLCTGCVGP
jgi:hypothetical protein